MKDVVLNFMEVFMKMKKLFAMIMALTMLLFSNTQIFAKNEMVVSTSSNPDTLAREGRFVAPEEVIEELFENAARSRSCEKTFATVIDDEGNSEKVEAYVIDTTNVVENNTDVKFQTVVARSYYEEKKEDLDPDGGIKGYVTMGYVEDGNRHKLTHAGGGYSKALSSYRVSSQLLKYENSEYHLIASDIVQTGQKEHRNDVESGELIGYTEALSVLQDACSPDMRREIGLDFDIDAAYLNSTKKGGTCCYDLDGKEID